jgi:hypothetical protein
MGDRNNVKYIKFTGRKIKYKVVKIEQVLNYMAYETQW